MVRAAGWQPGNVDCTVIARGARSSPRVARRWRTRLSRRRRRAGEREGEASRGARRDRPRRGHRLLRRRHRHGRSRMSPAKRGGRKPPPSRFGEAASDARPRQRTCASRRARARAVIRSRDGRPCARLLLAGRRVRELWVATDLDEASVVDEILELAREMRVRCARSVAARWRPRPAPTRPKECSPRQRRCNDVELDELAKARSASGAKPFLIVVDGVTDPGNLGALLRSASCAGATGVVLPRHRAVHVTPDGREGRGRGDRAPADGARRWHPERARAPRELGVWVVGLDMVAERTLFELGDVADEPIALVLGAEGMGLSRLDPAALRRGRSHPARRPARVAERRDCRRVGLLRDHTTPHSSRLNTCLPILPG